jgi:hypothetical protein
MISAASKSRFAFIMNTSYPAVAATPTVTVDVDTAWAACGALPGQILPDFTVDSPVRIFAGIPWHTHSGLHAAHRWHHLCGNGGHGDDPTFGKPLPVRSPYFASFGQCEPPRELWIDGDVIGCKGHCDRTLHHRSSISAKQVPNELRKVVPVLLVACPVAFGGKIN